MDKPKRNSLATMLGSLVLGALFGAALVSGFLAARGTDTIIERPDLGLGWTLVLLLGGAVTLFLVITAHELGHLLGGRIARFRFLLLVVGPLKVTRSAEGLAFSWNRSLPLAGGLAASGPAPEDLDDLPRRSAYMVLGGPLASLSLGAVAIFAYRVLADAPAMSTSPAYVVLVWLVMLGGATSALVGVTTLIPGRTSGFMTDGARLLQLLRGGPAAEAEIAVQTLVAWSTGGVRPEEWLDDVIARALTAPPGPFQVVAQHFAWRHAAYTGDAEAERRYREGLLERLEQAPDAVQAGLLLDLSTARSLAGDREQGRALYDRVVLRGAILDPHAEPMARAALAAVEGDFATARRLAEDAAAVVGRSMDPGTAALDRERLERIRTLALESGTS